MSKLRLKIKDRSCSIWSDGPRYFVRSKCTCFYYCEIVKSCGGSQKPAGFLTSKEWAILRIINGLHWFTAQRCSKVSFHEMVKWHGIPMNSPGGMDCKSESYTWLPDQVSQRTNSVTRWWARQTEWCKPKIKRWSVKHRWQWKKWIPLKSFSK